MSATFPTPTIESVACPWCASVLDPDCALCDGDRLVVPFGRVVRLLEDVASRAGRETLMHLLEESGAHASTTGDLT